LAPAGVNGLLYGGGGEQLGKQAIGALSVMAYSFAVALIIGLILKAAGIMRVTHDDELSGVDLVEHAESAYELGEAGGGGHFAGIGAGAARRDREEI
jgi:Amt family ammonium transporter